MNSKSKFLTACCSRWLLQLLLYLDLWSFSSALQVCSWTSLRGTIPYQAPFNWILADGKIQRHFRWRLVEQEKSRVRVPLSKGDILQEGKPGLLVDWWGSGWSQMASVTHQETSAGWLEWQTTEPLYVVSYPKVLFFF